MDIKVAGDKASSIGEIPRDWSVAEFGDLFDIQQGKALNKKAREGPSPRSFLRTANVFWGELDLSKLDEMSFDDRERAKYELVPGDLLVCEGGEIGRTAIWRGEAEECYYQNHLHRCRAAQQSVDPDFYMYWMRHAILQRRLYEGHGNVTTIANLSKSRLSSFKVAVPPFPEQRAIARVLRIVQQAREETEQVIDAARELKRSLMAHLFAYGPVEVMEASSVRTTQTDIGQLPADWPLTTVGDLFHIQQGKAMSRRAREGSDQHPFLRTGNVYWNRFNLSQIDEMEFNPAEREKYSLASGDMLVCEGGAYAGRTAVWEGQIEGIYFQNHLHRCRAIDSGTRPDFVSRWIECAWTMRNLYGGSRNTSAIPNISKSRLAAYQVPNPPTEVQDEMLASVNAVDHKIATEEDRRDALSTLFSSLLSELMSGRLRVPESMWDSAA